MLCMCVSKDKGNFCVLLRQYSSLETKIETEWFIALVSFSENANETISKISKFLMGISKVPATGLHKNVTVKFKHGYFPSVCNMGKCLTTVSTCEIIINPPVRINNEEDMINAFKDAL